MANTYTTKLGLAKPANGDVDWHIPINDNWDKIDTDLDKALKISGTTIDADKDWGGKNITNMGKISPKTWLILVGTDPLLISKSHASSTTVSFAQLDGTGHVKVIVKSPEMVAYGGGPRVFNILKNGVEVWSQSQSYSWNGEDHVFTPFTATAFEDLSVTNGDILTISRTAGPGSVTVDIYATPLVAPYGIVM
jgi:hypothetical protein